MAKASTERPTLIVCHTTIGRGSPGRAGTAKAHGEPLGAEEIARTREALGWTAPPFEVPDNLRALWDARELGKAREAEWNARLAAYRAAHPALAAEFERRMRGDLPADFDATLAAAIDAFGAAPEAVASRKASQKVLAALAPKVPEMFGGSADLTGSNLTDFPGCGERHVSYGVREFGMAAIMNGVALHGGYIPYGGTFLTFSDYSRNAVRMAALMKLRVIHVFTHDSIGLGEDGPTHQAVEHVPSLRLIPQLDVWRPADTIETAVAWASALQRRDGPAALALSRQVLPVVATPAQAEAIARGGYVLSDVPAGQAARAVIIGTGSELQFALQAQTLLAAEGLPVRVVSMPCTNVFDRQPAELPRPGAASAACRRWRWKPRSPTSGASTSAARAVWSASPASANRRRRPTCTSISASPPSMWRPRCGGAARADLGRRRHGGRNRARRPPRRLQPRLRRSRPALDLGRGRVRRVAGGDRRARAHPGLPASAAAMRRLARPSARRWRASCTRARTPSMPSWWRKAASPRARACGG